MERYFYILATFSLSYTVLLTIFTVLTLLFKFTREPLQQRWRLWLLSLIIPLLLWWILADLSIVKGKTLSNLFEFIPLAMLTAVVNAAWLMRPKGDLKIWGFLIFLTPFVVYFLTPPSAE